VRKNHFAESKSSIEALKHLVRGI